MKFKFFVFSILVCLIAFPAISGATPVLKISSGDTMYTIVDGDAADRAIGDAGVVGYSGLINGWKITDISGDATIGSLMEPIFDVSGNVKSISTTPRLGNDALTIMFSEEGFTGLDIQRFFEENIGGTLAYNGTITARAYYGTGLFDLSNPLPELTFTSSNYPGAFFGGVSSTIGVPNQSFSMTQIITITHPAASISWTPATSFDVMLSDQVPEPSSLILLGSGLVGAGLFFRRKQAK